MQMKLFTKSLREYAAKVLQAADLLDDVEELKPTTVPSFTEQPDKPPRKPMSKAARHRIAVAQRKRWRLIRGGKRAA